MLLVSGRVGIDQHSFNRLANFGTFVALASYSRQKAASDGDRNGRRKSDYGVKFGAMMQTVLSMALTLYMW